jgi:hypothetical protein
MAAKGPARASLRYAKAPLSPRYQWELHQLLGHCSLARRPFEGCDMSRDNGILKLSSTPLPVSGRLLPYRLKELALPLTRRLKSRSTLQVARFQIMQAAQGIFQSP